MYILLALIPLFIGGILALINSLKINETTENIENWFKRNKASNNLKRHWFRRFILKPLFYTFSKLFDWTSSLNHKGVKSGIRITFTIYFVLIWIGIIAFLAFMAVQVLIAAAFLFLIWIFLRTWLEKKGILERDDNHPLANAQANDTMNRETGEFERESFFGKEKTGKKIDLESGEIFEKGIIGWNSTGIGVDQKTGIIQEDGIFGYTDTKLKIHPKTGIIQKEELFGWTDTKYRVSPETGKKQMKGVFGWDDL